MCANRLLLPALCVAVCAGLHLRAEPRELVPLQPGQPGDTLPEALAWLTQRQASYAASGTPFGRRGAAWLRGEKGLVLALRLDTQQSLIRIVNLASEDICDASRVTIWVRARGPELHAGLAQPSPTSCEWTFDLSGIQAVGEYTAEAKLLNYDGGADVEPGLCNEVQGSEYQGTLLRHFQGSKLYHQSEACCEACTREQGCDFWTSPGLDGTSHCTFLTASNGSGVVPAEGGWHGARGTRREEPSSYYMGCGWSFQLTKESPCAEPNDDRVMNFGLTFSVRSTGSQEVQPPTCASPAEANGPGRWVQLTTEEQTRCSKQPFLGSVDVVTPAVFPIMKYSQGDGVCWYQDALHDIGKNCREMDCMSWGAGHHSISPLSQPGQVVSFSWSPYACSLKVFEPSEIQECITQRSIKSIKVLGDSISRFFKPYVQLRLEGMQFSTDSNHIKVDIDNLDVVHVIWGKNEREWAKAIKMRLTAVPKHNHLLLWVSSPFVSSERENKISVERALRFTEMWREAAKSRPNVIELNYFAATAAFTYESSAQQDGMHIVGPPMKALFNMAMAAACTATV